MVTGLRRLMVKRLRYGSISHELCEKAADMIERLVAEVESLQPQTAEGGRASVPEERAGSRAIREANRQAQEELYFPPPRNPK